MTNPTPLSPAAQAVMIAFGTYPLRADHISEDLVPALAAALRAAVEHCTYQDAWKDKFLSAERILAIAAELETH